MNRLLIAIATTLTLSASVHAQTPAPPIVPAIPGAVPDAVNRPIAQPPDLARQARVTDQAVAEARARDASLGTSGSLTVADASGTKAVPPAPTPDDVRRAERRLARLKSQVHVDEVTDTGLVAAPASGHNRARIVFPYVESSIYEIYSAPDRMTSIELQPGEHLTTENGRPKAADTVQWVADTVNAGEGPNARTIILVKPILAGIETNMLIPTNRRVYHLLLRSESQTYMPVVGFSYEFDEAKAREASEMARVKEEAAREQVAVPPEKLEFRYAVKGAKVVWRPVRVFDDGQKTYIEMSAAVRVAEAPALFVMEDKTPLLVNYRVKGDFYIVDRLFAHAQLRVGPKAVDVYRDKT
jgi:type IV secretion system protein VirB9